jgi:galactoside 2-L-fucosyltransferase 1/2
MYQKFILLTLTFLALFIFLSFGHVQSLKGILTTLAAPLYFILNYASPQHQNEELATVNKNTIEIIRPPCVIVLDTTVGRLGDLMFNFASAYGIAKLHDCSLYLNERITTNLTAVFDINLPNRIYQTNLNEMLKRGKLTVRHSECNFFSDLLRPNAVSYLELRGHWHAFDHFLKNLDAIRYQFTFTDNVVHSILPFLKRYIPEVHSVTTGVRFQNLKKHISTKSTVQWIGIHVRRGDILAQESVLFEHTIPSIDYIKRAMAYFNSRYVEKTLFFVACDDKAYCEQMSHGLTTVQVTPRNYSPAEDLAVLSLCHDTILTGGTFGWWVGVLASGVVVHDNTYSRKKSPLETNCSKTSYFPSWFLLM